MTKKRVRVKRGTLNAMDLDSVYTYDNEGRNTSMQYPASWENWAGNWVAGPARTITYDNMGRLKELKDTNSSTYYVTGTTYNPMGELLTMTGSNGAPSETRAYNSLGQMTQQVTVPLPEQKSNRRSIPVQGASSSQQQQDEQQSQKTHSLKRSG